jgi:hypothetical protein
MTVTLSLYKHPVYSTSRTIRHVEVFYRFIDPTSRVTQANTSRPVFLSQCINDVSISFFSASASSIPRCVLDPAPGGRLHCAPAMIKPISASHGAFAAKFRCVMRITPGP